MAHESIRSKKDVYYPSTVKLTFLGVLVAVSAAIFDYVLLPFMLGLITGTIMEVVNWNKTQCPITVDDMLYRVWIVAFPGYMVSILMIAKEAMT